jgi:hypothetical protein
VARRGRGISEWEFSEVGGHRWLNALKSRVFLYSPKTSFLFRRMEVWRGAKGGGGTSGREC